MQHILVKSGLVLVQSRGIAGQEDPSGVLNVPRGARSRDRYQGF